MPWAVMTADSVSLIAATTAIKVTLLWPTAMVALGGTVTFGLLLDSDRTVPPAGAVPEIVMVQALLPGAVTVAGEQLKVEGCICEACTFNAAVTVPPFRAAVRVITAELDIAAADAVNIAVICPYATATLAGTVTFALLLDSRTVVPPVGAAALILTWHALVPGAVRTAGVQLSEVTCNCCGDTVKPAVAVPPLSVAVRVTYTVLSVLCAEAVKVAVLSPEGTLTLEGTLTFELLLARATVLPPAGAFPLRVIVQPLVAGPVTMAGVQSRLTTRSCCGVTVNPVVAELPLISAVKVTLTGVVVACADAMKVALFCAAFNRMVGGTVTAGLLLDSETVAPPAGAAGLMVTVQLAVAGPRSVGGVQLRLVTWRCVCDTLSSVVAVLPFSPAVSVTVTRLEVAPDEVVNAALFWPTATVTDVGTVTRGLLLDSDTMAPPAGATGLIETVQPAVPGPLTVDGVQFKAVTRSGCADTFSEAVAGLPLRVAVSVALTATAVAAAEAVKATPDCPPGTATLEGTVTVGLLLDNPTTVPPAGEGPLSVNVQLAVAGPVTVDGVQLMLLTSTCCGDTVKPPVAVLPFSDAVRVAFTADWVVLADAVNAAEFCPD